MAEAPRQVQVGVGAIISDGQGRVIVGRRKGSTGANQWGLPGGHLEFGEEYFGCAERETLEETGLRVRATRMVTITSSVFEDVRRHYITIFVKCVREDPGQQPETLEPDKCEGWAWKSWPELRSLLDAPHGKCELFLPIVNLFHENPDVEALMSG